jgi:hypothetical protein
MIAEHGAMMTNKRRRGAGHTAPSGLFSGMDRLFDFLVPVALAAVLITLAVGIYALFKGGDFGRSYSNKLMRLRVLLQFVAILVLLGAAWAWKH